MLDRRPSSKSLARRSGAAQAPRIFDAQYRTDCHFNRRAGSGVVAGYVTQRLGLSPIVGYLLAGVAVGDNTPFFVADHELASQLAEVGVVLLMFGVGLHFHFKELLAVRKIAVPGAIGQIVAATALGAVAARCSGRVGKRASFSAWRSRWPARSC